MDKPTIHERPFQNTWNLHQALNAWSEKKVSSTHLKLFSSKLRLSRVAYLKPTTTIKRHYNHNSNNEDTQEKEWVGEWLSERVSESFGFDFLLNNSSVKWRRRGQLTGGMQAPLLKPKVWPDPGLIRALPPQEKDTQKSNNVWQQIDIGFVKLTMFLLIYTINNRGL